SVRTAVRLKTGDLRNWRNAKKNSRIVARMGSPEHGWVHLTEGTFRTKPLRSQVMDLLPCRLDQQNARRSICPKSRQRCPQTNSILLNVHFSARALRLRQIRCGEFCRNANLPKGFAFCSPCCHTPKRGTWWSHCELLQSLQVNFDFGRLFHPCSSYVHRRIGVTMQRTHLNIVATVETTISRMPANVEAERSILGAILLDNHAYNDAAQHLKPGDFSLDAHRRIYSRMMDLSESSQPIDLITLVHELDRKKDLQAVGDVGYVSSLLDGVPDRP